MSAPERVTPLAFLDTETTGLDPRRCEVWEVAIVRAEHHPEVHEDADGKSCPGRLVVLDEYERQIDVHHLEDADPYGLEVGGYHDRRKPQTQRIRPKGAATEVEKRTRGRMMVGAVPSFDAAFLTKLLHEHGRPVTWHYQLIDVETLVAGYLAGFAAGGAPDSAHVVRGDDARPEIMVKRAEGAGFGGGTRGPYVDPLEMAQPPWRSDDLLGAVGVTVPEVERHTALGDARWAMRAYAAVYGLELVGGDA